MQLTKSSKSKRALPKEGIPLSGGMLRLHVLRSRIFRNERLLRVWLPPGYRASGGVRYPVFYLNDGQNLFEAATAFAGVAWQVAEAAAGLIAAGRIPPLIIAGVDNTGKDRIREYVPYRSSEPRIWNPQGSRYPEFLRGEVMPLVERNYAVAKGPEHTGLGGSSLGGLITLYTHLAMPRVFGRLLIESPSLLIANRRILEECRRFHDWPARIYLAIGTREAGSPAKDEKAVNDVRELATTLQGAGLDEHRLRVRIAEGASHSEAEWAKRFPEALEFLFGR